MVTITLAYNGVEKTLSQWGYSDGDLVIRSRQASTFTITKAPADPAQPPDIPYLGSVIIYAGRVFSGNSWSGGIIIFQGRRTDYSGMASPERATTSMVFSDPLWDLNKIVFQHYWRTGGTGVNGVPSAFSYSSRLFLFQDIHIASTVTVPWAILTADKQILEIIQYAALQGANLQPGTIDPAIQFPTQAVKAISCWEALSMCLRSVPDTVTYFDYTTTPPTLHVRQAGNLPAQSVPYNGTDSLGRKHKSSDVKTMDSERPPAVQIQYQTTTTINGVGFVTTNYDTYPVGHSATGLGVQIIPIDIRGGIFTQVNATVESVAIDPTTTAFWKKFKPELGSTEVTGLTIIDTAINGGTLVHPQGITIQDSNGNPISLATYPNAIIGGQVAPWMTYNGVPIVDGEVTVTGFLSYTKQIDQAQNPSAPNFFPLEKNIHQVNVRLKLTNSPAGSIPYQATQSITTGDPQPIGLAKYLWTAFNAYVIDGTHTIIDDALSTIVTPGTVLNITGGNPAWAAMNAVVTENTIRFHANSAGLQTIKFGPHKHLGPTELVQFLDMWSFRRVYDNPNIRNSGVDNSGVGTQLGVDTQKENTTENAPTQSLFSAFSFDGASGALPSGQNFNVQVDAINQKIIMQQQDTTGALVTGVPSVNLAISQLQVNGGVGDIVEFQNWNYTDNTGTPQTVRVAASSTATIGSGGSVNYRGVYNSATTYNVGDIVRVQAGTSQGVWICVITNPGSAHQPTFPEPVSTGGTNYWDMWTFGVVVASVCDGGTKTVYINSTTPA